MMEPYQLSRDKSGGARVRVPYCGHGLLQQPMYNKGTAFTSEERAIFGLDGLLPPQVNSLEQQARRVYDNIVRKTDAVERSIGLLALLDRNEHLFYRVVLDHLEEFLPIVYTPTVGLLCQGYSRMFRRARGLWITPAQRGRIFDVLGHAPFDDVRLIVVTDNERILGLGDQGAGGIGIPIGKLALYVAAAGIHPAQTLPISLDVGTDNTELLNDPLYLGWRMPRLRGAEYDELVEEFVQAVQCRFPRALLQWEDFKKQNALNLLDRYRQRICSFNDDIQGTAGVALAAILGACRVSRTPLAQQRIVILGAGAAGIGIARLLRDALRRAGLEEADLPGAIALLDSSGMLVATRSFREPSKNEFAWPVDLAKPCGLDVSKPIDLAQVVQALKPSVLIGTSGEPGAFTEPIVRAMAAHCRRPAIFPFSNPTSKSEAVPADLLAWTEGRALIATGSPFDPVTYAGRSFRIAQGNNVFIFPGVGLGCLVAEAKAVTDGMFAVAAEALAQCLTDEDLAAGAILPRVSELRQVSGKVAQAVVREARAAGVAERPISDDAIAQAVAAAMWTPEYPVYEPAWG